MGLMGHGSPYGFQAVVQGTTETRGLTSRMMQRQEGIVVQCPARSCDPVDQKLAVLFGICFPNPPRYAWRSGEYTLCPHRGAMYIQLDNDMVYVGKRCVQINRQASQARQECGQSFYGAC